MSSGPAIDEIRRVSTSVPVTEFVVRMDDAHYRAVIALLGPARRPMKLRTVASTAFAVVVLLGFAIRCIVDENWSGLVVPGVLIALVGIVLFHMEKQRRAALQKSPDYGKDVRVRIARSGVEMIGSVATSTFQWSAFGRAVLAADGILFVMTDGAGLWLPSGSLVAGARDSVERLIVEHVPEVERR